jgi:CBS domain-containing protein
VSELANLRDAIDQMARSGYGIVPVVARDLRVIGLVSRTDVLTAEAQRLDDAEGTRKRD